MRTSLTIVIMLFGAGCLAASQSKPKTTEDSIAGLSAETQKKMEQLAKVQKAFEVGAMNSPGFIVTLEEKNRRKTPDRTLITYNLHAKGFSRDKLYSLSQVDIAGAV